MSKFTCPFCLSTFNRNEIEYYCLECGNTVKGKLFSRGPVRCSCGGYATKRTCPKCLSAIPAEALETPNYMFSIVGAAGSGKTMFTAAMIRELRDGGLYLTVGSETMETRNHQMEMERLIYKYNEVPPCTNQDEVFPQIWYVRNNREINRNDVPTYTFTIYDEAGESFEKMDPNAMVYRHIYESTAIILTIDSVGFFEAANGGSANPEVLDMLCRGEVNDKENKVAFIKSVIDYIKTARGIKTMNKIDIPVAVVFTKMDTVLSHPEFDNQMSVKNNKLPIRDEKVDSSELKQVDSEIRSWLLANGADELIRSFDLNFKEYMLFGVSSFGEAPKDGHTLPEKMQPHRILDPMIWLLWKEKIIK